MKNFIKADDSRVSYAQWKASWKPPQTSPRALKKKAVVEFMPFQAGGSLFVAEGVSKTAMMVHCHNGDVPVGTEVAIGSLNGTEFECEGRRFTIVNIDDILLMEVAA